MATRSSRGVWKLLLLVLVSASIWTTIVTETSNNDDMSEDELPEPPVLLNKQKDGSRSLQSPSKVGGTQPRALSMAYNLSKVVNELLKQISESKTNEDYEVALSNYETFKAKNKDQGICLPRAPQRRRDSDPQDRVQKDCTLGYRIGWRHGKRWAHIIVRNGDPKNIGKEKVECFLNSLEPNHVEARHVCALKGAMEGYDRWYTRLTDPKAKEAFDRLKEAEPSALVEINRPVRTQMNEQETLYAQAFNIAKPNN